LQANLHEPGQPIRGSIWADKPHLLPANVITPTPLAPRNPTQRSLCDIKTGRRLPFMLSADLVRLLLQQASDTEHSVVVMTQPLQLSAGGFAVVLGTSEIASAVAVYLHRAGCCVVMSHDPFPPVIRRKMAFHDALYGDPTMVEGIAGTRADDGVGIFNAIRSEPSATVHVTWLSLTDLMPVAPIDVLVDARMQKHRVTPDLRGLARLSIGLGPGFSTRTNCDVAIETRPGRNGLMVTHGWTDAADGVASPLGGVGSERFQYSEAAGRWHTAVEIGSRVFKGFVLGHLAGVPVRAPCDGILRGIVRDGADVPQSVKLLEIDPRGRDSQWTGIDQRGRTIAGAVLRAVSTHRQAQHRPLPQPFDPA
jgi:hypothetical protein